MLGGEVSGAWQCWGEGGRLVEHGSVGGGREVSGAWQSYV